MSAASLMKPRRNPSLLQLEPVLKQRHFHRLSKKWCIPFPGVDTEIIRRTQRSLSATDKLRPVQYQSYLTLPSIFITILVVLAGALIFVFSKVGFLRRFLLNYPRLCSFGKVRNDDMVEGTMDDMVLQYDMYGEGWKKGVDSENIPPNEKLLARVTVSGRDTPYVGTAVVLIYSALTVLMEREKMPNTGGVLTPGIAFRNTSLMEKLQENNVKFEIVTNRPKK